MGDFVLSGGEIAAMAVVDSVARLIPGVLGDLESTREETFEDNLLEYPQYTRPLEYRGLKVPDVLLSGHHGQVEAWRTQARYERTEQRRPDLLQKRPQ